jgi:hypothetical protein
MEKIYLETIVWADCGLQVPPCFYSPGFSDLCLLGYAYEVVFLLTYSDLTDLRFLLQPGVNIR